MSAVALMPPVDVASGMSEVSTTLPVSAGVAFEVFGDAVETPRWMPVVDSARVMARTVDGRPARVTFTGKLDRGSLSYTLGYTYDARQLRISWATDPDSSITIHGEARFLSLSPRASMLVYRLKVELPGPAGWGDYSYNGHAASAVVADFREYLRRLV